jgi:hypothetical protein
MLPLRQERSITGRKAQIVIQSVSAEKYKMEDRDLMNDRYINRFTAQLKNLKPGTTYEYQIPPQTNWSEKYAFSTPAQDSSFRLSGLVILIIRLR